MISLAFDLSNEIRSFISFSFISQERASLLHSKRYEIIVLSSASKISFTNISYTSHSSAFFSEKRQTALTSIFNHMNKKGSQLVNSLNLLSSFSNH